MGVGLVLELTLSRSIKLAASLGVTVQESPDNRFSSLDARIKGKKISVVNEKTNDKLTLGVATVVEHTAKQIKAISMIIIDKVGIIVKKVESDCFLKVDSIAADVESSAPDRHRVVVDTLGQGIPPLPAATTSDCCVADAAEVQN